MQRKAIAALMISLLLLSACGHGAGEQTFEAFRDTLTGKLVTVTAQVRVQRGDTVTDYTLTCQELPDGYDLTVTVPEQAAPAGCVWASREELRTTYTLPGAFAAYKDRMLG